MSDKYVTQTDDFVFFHKGWPAQWFRSDFTKDGVTYTCAEQWMMAKKAELFGDTKTLKAIMATSSPKEQKDLGRMVRNFDEQRWASASRDIVYNGNMLKFTQNKDLKKKLLSTGLKVFVEASPYDRIYGVGLAADDPKILDPSQWKGKNVLGSIITKVKQDIILMDRDW